MGPLVLYSTTRLRACSLILKGEVRRISTFANFVRDGSYSTGTTFLCENSGVAINAKECHSELTETLGNRALSYRTVARWAAAFQRRRVASADMGRTGACFTKRLV